MVASEVVEVVRLSASLAACYMFASLFPAVREVYHQQTTVMMPLLPILSMLANCICWGIYGVLVGDYFPLVATNSVGVVCSLGYLGVYYRYAPVKRPVQVQIAWAVGGLTLVAVYPIVSPEDQEQVKSHIGLIAITMAAVMIGSPLVVVKEVIQTKNTELLPLTMIVAGFLNSVSWLTYGCILADLFVILPNAVNLALGALQLAIVFWFGSHSNDKRSTKGYAKIEKQVALEMPMESIL